MKNIDSLIHGFDNSFYFYKMYSVLKEIKII